MMMNPFKWLNWKIQERIEICVNPAKIMADIKELRRDLGDVNTILEKLRCPHPRESRSVRTRGTDVVVCTKCNAALAVWEVEDKPTTAPKVPTQ